MTAAASLVEFELLSPTEFVVQRPVVSVADDLDQSERCLGTDDPHAVAWFEGTQHAAVDDE